MGCSKTPIHTPLFARRSGKCVESQIMTGNSSITTAQILGSILAIPAFLPAMIFPGYLVAWFCRLHAFRERSLVERFCWSIPLSISIATISSVLVGKYLSLTAVSVVLAATAVACPATFLWEMVQAGRRGKRIAIGWQPLGTIALFLAILWSAVAVLSLIDLQSGDRLHMSVTIFDQAFRVNWIDSILRTGVPPANSLYWSHHSVPMRSYYFWYVLCAAVAQMANLSARAVFIASCVWSGFALAALIALYLKHFLNVGQRLRKQTILCVALTMVAGLDIVVNLWHVFHSHIALPDDAQWWTANNVPSWLDSLLWVPHHVAGLICCMFAFLLASMPSPQQKFWRPSTTAIIALSLASAFGLSIYVCFAFTLIALAWGIWQVTVERKWYPTLTLGAGGAGACVLLIPYILELAHNPSGMNGSSVFAFAAREIISPDRLLDLPPSRTVANGHPLFARVFADLLLLPMGYFIEFGLFFIVLFIYLAFARRRQLLSPAHRSLLFIVCVTIPMISFIRSWVLESNDFGWRAALFAQFPLLLLTSELMVSRPSADRDDAEFRSPVAFLTVAPNWLRVSISLLICIGILSTVSQGLMLRFKLPLAGALYDPGPGSLGHSAYISSIGYAQLRTVIPPSAIVQYNPSAPNPYWMDIDMVNIGQQTAMVSNRLQCGSLWGGDPSQCASMTRDIDALFRAGSVSESRAVCSRYNIDYLVARIYDPVWKDKDSWVWNLKPVVAYEEFRALDCQK
jgi:hypothetical protein